MSEETKDIKKEEAVVEDKACETETPESDSKESKKDEKKVKKSKLEVENEKLKAQVAELEAKIKSDSEEYLKARADLENTRRRVFSDAEEVKKYASKNLINDLVNPVDMLFKVVDYKSENPEVQNYVYGFKMITDQIKAILEKDGLKEIKALNEKFDPNFHQAMSKEKRDGVEPGIVIEVIQTGYMYKDRLLRPAMVKVSE
ncbi:MAG: nucleotide exchange factor GrpE [Acholeplasmatales bacterium]|nr:nucleotide exchange factor GrpE [Acholeplasmatales bacterium]